MNAGTSFLENMDMMDPNFPILFHYDRLEASKPGFPSHWHDPIELLNVVRGNGVIICNTRSIEVKRGDLVVVNSNELHQGYCTSEFLEYYCIIADSSFFYRPGTILCEKEYTSQIYKNSILFQNKIENDKAINACIEGIAQEYEIRESGFELSVKSYLYRILVLLLRNYAKQVLTSNEYDIRNKNLVRLNTVIKYIGDHYNEPVSLDKLSSMASLSRYYLCHLFKDITGNSIGSYINQVRINNSIRLLRDSGMNVTETAMACGFSDPSYYSRLFRKLKKKSPLQVKKDLEHQ